MRTTLALDDELLAKAQHLMGLREKAPVIKEALKALIERESARRLSNLGGSEPELKAVSRRKTSIFSNNLNRVLSKPVICSRRTVDKKRSLLRVNDYRRQAENDEIEQKTKKRRFESALLKNAKIE